MFPLCFVHGVHGVRHDRDGASPDPDAVGWIAFRGRFVLAALTLVVVAALAFAGTVAVDRDAQPTVSEAPAIEQDDLAWPDFDITLLHEFP